MLDEPRNDPSLAALTLEATTASPATMTREPQGRQAAPTSRQPQEENPVSDNSRVCAGTSRQLSSAPAHHALVYSNLCKGQTGRRRRETFVSRSRFPPYHYRPTQSERPKLLFGKDGTPTHLFNGAITGRGTYTVVAPLNVPANR